MPRPVFLAALLALTAGAALADNFGNIDLRSVESQQLCMERAHQALVILAAENGSDNPDITQGSWSTFGWDFPPRAMDISIICPDIDGVTYPFATGHTTGDGNDPGDMIERLAEIFNKL
ncbi:hypothetical protein [Nioella aestuarii]|uniref:hypothetical protein n=1 Tax=Nioella aestuarii TaxID=1662864 RepID=UPI003D7FD1F2